MVCLCSIRGNKTNIQYTPEAGDYCPSSTVHAQQEYGITVSVRITPFLYSMLARYVPHQTTLKGTSVRERSLNCNRLYS